MTVQKFFEMLEKANEFKALVGEQKTKVFVSTNTFTIGDVYNYGQFENEIKESFAPAATTDILMAEVSQTNCVREFKITYIFEGAKNNIKLYVD